MPDVVVNMKGLDRFAAEIDRGLHSTSPGPMRNVLKQWAAVYRSFLQLRFVEFARGGGWTGLKRKTIKARRGRGIGVEILTDTGLLKGALQPQFIGAPGALEEHIPFGIRVGYGGPGQHPGGSATVAEIASYHQTGAGKLPVREIIVPPSDALMRRMASLMVRKLQEMAHGRA